MMALYSDDLVEAVDEIRKFVPEFRLAQKSQNWFMRQISRVFPKFKEYFTTVGYTSYAPDPQDMTGDLWTVVFHEGKHALRFQKFPGPHFFKLLCYGFLYFFPWTLLPLVIGLSFWHWWLVFGVLVCALPKVSLFRGAIELEGYHVNMLIDYWTSGTGEDLQWYDEQLSGPAYDYTLPKFLSREMFQEIEDHILQTKGDVSNDPYLIAVKAFIENRFGKKAS